MNQGNTALHPAQRRFQAEELVRSCRSDERRRFASPQRSARIDPNPHQIEAVIFALSRLREGGCILADEVGLGKTIEAGLVLAQLRAEGARRVLLVAPKPLLGQWREELFNLFGIHAEEVKGGAFEGEGVFLVGREAAGSERGQEALLASTPFDLCIIDEAHEVFSGVYKRFDKAGDYDDGSEAARTAGRLLEVLTTFQTPVLVLTATPIQNSLSELWGLVRFVDPLGTLLGDLPTFREVFCGVDDRQLARGQEEELRGRLKQVLQRTLRREAQDFLDKPFVDRQTKLFEYTMHPDERALYDDVTRYLLDPGIVAFEGSHRQLLLLGFHRRMGSSRRALAASIERVAARLRGLLGASGRADDARDSAEVMADLEEDEAPEESPASFARHPPETIRAELSRVEDFLRRTETLEVDSKAQALLQAVRFVDERAKEGTGSGKIVLFTESIATQEYLRDLLVESGLVTDEEVTLFRGQNDAPRARAALERWREETRGNGAASPAPDVAVRLALVHEFRTRSRVFISTEAGAKGLNLQFCETLVNYDLPWNPQRIEQRIGRCHRYGQKRGVTVINFLAKDNEAQRLTFDILSQKLELFDVVLDASDKVLHRPDPNRPTDLAGVLGADFESALRRIWERSRTVEEVEQELRRLREEMDEQRRRFVETHARTAGVIQERFSEDVKSVFRRRKEELPAALRALDALIDSVVSAHLAAEAIPHRRVAFEGGALLELDACERLPEGLREGGTVVAGTHASHPSLHLAHPLVLAAVASAREGGCDFQVRIRVSDPALRQRRGRLVLLKRRHEGFEKVEQLLPVVVFEDAADSPRLSDGLALLAGEVVDDPSVRSNIDDAAMNDAIEECLFLLYPEADAAERARFERALERGERFIEDRLLVQRRRQAELQRRLAEAELRRDGAVGAEARTAAEGQLAKLQESLEKVERKIDQLERREDRQYQAFREALHARRFGAPVTERLFDMHLVTE